MPPDTRLEFSWALAVATFASRQISLCWGGKSSFGEESRQGWAGIDGKAVATLDDALGGWHKWCGHHFYHFCGWEASGVVEANGG